MKRKIHKPEICYECDFIRKDLKNGCYICICPNSKYRDVSSISKAHKACECAVLNKEFVKAYPNTYYG